MPLSANPVTIDHTDDNQLLVARAGSLSRLSYTTPPDAKPEPCIFSLTDTSSRPVLTLYRVDLMHFPWVVPGLTDLIKDADVRFGELSVRCPPGATFTAWLS
jgi:hypothetical protein